MKSFHPESFHPEDRKPGFWRGPVLFLALGICMGMGMHPVPVWPSAPSSPVSSRDGVGDDAPTTTTTSTSGVAPGTSSLPSPVASTGWCFHGGREITLILPGGVPLVMVHIPAGSFIMGSPSSERNREPQEGPQTNVTLTRPFYLGKYPVTQGQWEAVMGSWPDTAPSSEFGAGPNHPAYWISWNDARNYITALNAHLASTGQGPATVRLPTEAEWEYACRAGTTTRFYFGDSLECNDWSEDCAAGTLPGNRSDYMWYWGNNDSPGQPGYGSKPVGQKLPNAFGLYDMSGNMWEWCQDWFDWSLPGGSVTDPTGSLSGLYRVLRGGRWGGNAGYCRSAYRSYCTPPLRGSSLGFRLASVR